jgi:1,4-dihydroxy-2-naphthoyl-CoA synthase
MRFLLASNTKRYALGTATAMAAKPLGGCAVESRFVSSQTTGLRDTYDNVQVEIRGDNSVGLIRLHRPKALNALSDALFDDLIHAATALDQNDQIGCLVLTGSTKAFAAGADISEMKNRTFPYAYQKVRGARSKNVKTN